MTDAEMQQQALHYRPVTRPRLYIAVCIQYMLHVVMYAYSRPITTFLVTSKVKIVIKIQIKNLFGLL